MMIIQKLIPALPFCHVRLKSQKPLPKAYPLELKTLGDHLKKRRLDLKLLQKQVAQIIDVDEVSICNWENNRTTPTYRYIPNIIKFLGYVTFSDKAGTLGEKIISHRRLSRMTQKELAIRLGIDPSTLARWERNEGSSSRTLTIKTRHLI